MYTYKEMYDEGEKQECICFLVCFWAQTEALKKIFFYGVHVSDARTERQNRENMQGRVQQVLSSTLLNRLKHAGCVKKSLQHIHTHTQTHNTHTGPHPVKYTMDTLHEFLFH